MTALICWHQSVDFPNKSEFPMVVSTPDQTMINLLFIRTAYWRKMMHYGLKSSPKLEESIFRGNSLPRVLFAKHMQPVIAKIRKTSWRKTTSYLDRIYEYLKLCTINNPIKPSHTHYLCKTINFIWADNVHYYLIWGKDSLS